jgi:phage repressor protein C with HTH and peptisase S24 domain
MFGRFHANHHIQETLVTQVSLALPQENLASSIRDMTIHQRIKDLREEKGLSMEALGALVGVKYQTVQQWENGGTSPKRDRIQKLAHALHTTPEYLSFGTGERHPENKNGDSPKVHSLRYSLSTKNIRRVFVVGRAAGGLPERIWTDGDYPVGATDEYAEIATTDPHAFLTPVVGTSMVPKFNPGDFIFVEPGTTVEPGDDVLVRLESGETLIKKLVSTRGGTYEFYSYNERGCITSRIMSSQRKSRPGCKCALAARQEKNV